VSADNTAQVELIVGTIVRPWLWGSVEGLSISMFTLAVIGNATYMSSILARSTAWGRIQPNLPWLVDAGACLSMDAVILGQYARFMLRDRWGLMDSARHIIGYRFAQNTRV
jgi:hypothetical protein